MAAPCAPRSRRSDGSDSSDDEPTTMGIKRAGVMPGKLRRVQRMEATVKGSPKVPAVQQGTRGSPEGCTPTRVQTQRRTARRHASPASFRSDPWLPYLSVTAN